MAERAGVALGTIFAHFPDKGALLIAAVLDDLATTDQQILATLPGEAPIREQILHVAAGGFGYWCERPRLSVTLLREMWFVQGAGADQRREETARFLQFVAELLRSGQRRGEIRDDADVHQAAESMYSFYVGQLIRAAADGNLDQKRLLTVTRTFLDQLLTGIGGGGQYA